VYWPIDYRVLREFIVRRLRANGQLLNVDQRVLDIIHQQTGDHQNQKQVFDLFFDPRKVKFRPHELEDEDGNQCRITDFPK
jgi:hypothetical protein